jgi:hypothetical protein
MSSAATSAGPIPPGTYSFTSAFSDVHPPVVGIASFNGTQFVSPSPTDTLQVTLDGTLEQDYPNATFQITSPTGFTVLPNSTYVEDPSGTIHRGDTIFGSLGSGSFKFSDVAGVIFSGTFTQADFTSTIGSNSLVLQTNDVDGLVLTPGPAFTFSGGTDVSAILAPEGFSLSLVSIPSPGVQATKTGSVIGGLFIPASMNPFGVSNGSVDASGTIIVSGDVPEPTSLTSLGGLALAALLIASRRRPNR